jgi:hypothetical protein
MVCLLLLGLLAGRTVHAQIDPVQAGGLALSVDRARLELPGGRALRLDLPPRAEVTSLAELGQGWIAAGSALDEDGRRRLFLMTGDASAARPVLPPPGQPDTERRGAVLLVEDGTLAGLAWLEGDSDRSLSVRAAAWNGHAWRAVEPVSQPGPGSQLALAGAVLADGSWLLAWSAFDGQDDEIVWARRTAEGWSPARPVSGGNSVPDITPALVASGNGALLAWSLYDGESYRVQLARFDGSRWRDERPAGPSGSLFPTFQSVSDHLYLLHLNAFPRSWSVLALDPAGKVLRRGTALSSLVERPVLGEDAESGIRLRWISGRRETTATWEKVP